MEIILLKEVTNLGNFGEKINVKAGYARNFLIPQGMAVLANKKNLDSFEMRCREIEKQKLESFNNALKIADKINSIGEVEIKAKVGKSGRLFGSIGTRDIVNALNLKDIQITRNAIRLPDGILRSIGKHEIFLHLHHDINVRLVINLTSS
ncbi:MAG: 50S ribosomal protein L9 [Candidatus Dasytiphilus stammeri]